MDSMSILNLLAVGQASKEVTANALFNAASPAMMYANNPNTTVSLTWGYYGGFVWNTGNARLPEPPANGTVALTASLTNYVELDLVTGAVSANTTAFTAGRLPLYSVLCGASSITSYLDFRTFLPAVRQGATVASANNLVLGSGDRFQVSGTTQLNLLSNTGRQGGSIVTLHTQGILTIKHNQAASGNNKPFFNISGADITTAAKKQYGYQYDLLDATWYQLF